MSKVDQIPDKQYIFGVLLVIANRMDTLLERELKEFGITSKQWFLTIMIDSLFDKPPTIKEAAREMGSSHQNVKQVALKLQEKNLLEIVKDKKDARVSRLKMTEQSYSFWERLQPKGAEFMETMFSGIDKDKLTEVRQAMDKILSNLLSMEKGNEEGIDEE